MDTKPIQRIFSNENSSTTDTLDVMRTEKNVPFNRYRGKPFPSPIPRLSRFRGVRVVAKIIDFCRDSNNFFTKRMNFSQNIDSDSDIDMFASNDSSDNEESEEGEEEEDDDEGKNEVIEEESDSEEEDNISKKKKKKKKKIKEEEIIVRDPKYYKYDEIEQEKAKKFYSYDFMVSDKYRVTREIIDEHHYRVRHFNGFMQLLMEPYGEAYFICQAMNQYLLPDWKLHVSVVQEDYQKTWNLLKEIYFKHKLIAMKMQIQDTWSKFGRGFTIYMYTYHKKYDEFEISFQWEPRGEVMVTRFKKVSYLCNPESWWNLIDIIEKTLSENDIRPAGVEKGEFSLGKYVSLRNESFTRINVKNLDFNPNSEDERHHRKFLKKLQYPPDLCGWNPQKHLNFPLDRFSEKSEDWEPWDLEFCYQRIDDSDYFLFPRVYIPRTQCNASKYPKLLQKIRKHARNICDLKEYEIKFNDEKNVLLPQQEQALVIRGIITSLTLSVFYSSILANKKRSMLFLCEMFERKDVWGAMKKLIRPLVLKELLRVSKFSIDESVKKFAKLRLAMLRKKYFRKKKYLSHAKRCLLVRTK